MMMMIIPKNNFSQIKWLKQHNQSLPVIVQQNLSIYVEMAVEQFLHYCQKDGLSSCDIFDSDRQ